MSEMGRETSQLSAHLENVFEGPWDDSSLSGGIIDALHRKTFPAASLAVGKNSPIVSLQHALDRGTLNTLSFLSQTHLYEPESDVIIDLFCRRVFSVYSVKRKTFRRVVGHAGVDDGANIIRVVYVNNFLKK